MNESNNQNNVNNASNVNTPVTPVNPVTPGTQIPQVNPGTPVTPGMQQTNIPINNIAPKVNKQANDIMTPENSIVMNGKDLEPITLGILRKEKIGNPLLVFELLAILIVVLLASDKIVNSYESDDGWINKQLIKIGLKKSQDTKEFDANIGDYKIGISSEYKYYFYYKVNDSLTSKINISQISINGTYMTMNMSRENNNSELTDIDLDKKEWYLEIYSSSEDDSKLITTVKFTGTITESVDTFKYTLPRNLNSGQKYYVKFKDMEGQEYPTNEFKSTLENQIVLTCSYKDTSKYTRDITYKFSGNSTENWLESITEEYFMYKPKTEDATEDYANAHKQFLAKAEKYNALPTAQAEAGEGSPSENEEEGFYYFFSINITEETEYPEDNDPEYYKSSLSSNSTDADVIYYAMTAKGYKCVDDAETENE